MEEKLIERLVQRIQNANDEILIEIGKALKKMGSLNTANIHKIQQQLKYGESLQKIVKIITKMSNLTEKDIYNILESVAKNDLEFSKIYYEAKKIDFIPYEKNEPLKMLVNEIAQSTMQTYQNISRTAGITFLNANKERITSPIINAYWQIIDDSALKVAQGKIAFEKALKDQIKVLGSSGIKSIEYESGRTKRLDSAIRMNMQDALSQLAIGQQQIMGEQFGTDAYEVSVHEYPAPDHEDIQGHKFDIDNWNKLQDYTYMGKFKDVNGKVYIRDSGNPIRAIGTLNCRHIAFSTILEAPPRYTQEQLNQINKRNEKGFDFEDKHYSLYNGAQLLKQLELQLRDLKSQQVLARASGQLEEAQKYQRNINVLTDKYNQITQISGLPTFKERMSVSKYRKIKVKK